MEYIDWNKIDFIKNSKANEKGVKMSEEKNIFKSYLRRLLQDLQDLKGALDNKEYERASEMTDKLVKDTQKDIEDN